MIKVVFESHRALDSMLLSRSRVPNLRLMIRATGLVDASRMHQEALNYAGAPPPSHFQPMVTLSTFFHGHFRVVPSCASRDIVT